MITKTGRRAPDKLRKAAEAELAQRATSAATPPRSGDELLHEFQVYQIELEMQNEALRQSQAELEKSRDRYLDLYDFAPVGLLTLTPEAIIGEINFAAAGMLGKERKNLLSRRFETFVAPDDKALWRRRFLDALQKEGIYHCEIALQRGGGTLHAGAGCMGVRADGKPEAVRVALTDNTGRRQVELELKERQQLLRKLAAKSVVLREAELKHLAREVHDELGQLLTALRMEVSLLRIQFGKHDPALMQKIEGTLALVDKTIQGARNVAVNLRPAALDMGVVPALVWLCDNFPGRAATACTLRVNNDPVGLDEARTATIYRIVQESLTNVARYAEANKVEITIGQHGGDVTVAVCDDGKGFDPEDVQKNKAFGLLGMHERALAVGGMVNISSAPSKGTVVYIRIPTSPHSLPWSIDS